MTNSYQPEDVATADNERALRALVRAIELSQGQFRLILGRCNYAALRDRMEQKLQELFPKPIRQIVLPESVKTLYTTIKTELDSEQPSALMLFGLESVSNLDRVIISTNQVREEFRENLPFPIVLWINDRVLQKLIRLAPDFESWATTVEFKLANNDLLDFIQQKTEQVLAAHETINLDRCFEIQAAHKTINLDRCFEIQAAHKDLQSRGQKLEPELEASLEFVLGIDDYANNQLDTALDHYHRSLNFYQHNYCLEKQGILLLNIALAFDCKAEQNRAESQHYWQVAKDYHQQCIDVLRQAQRRDLVAQHINKLLVVMQRLQEWNQLKTLAQKALLLHQRYDKPLHLAQDYGFLAEVALKDSNWKQAEKYARQALQVLDTIPAPSHEKGFYRFLLAQSQQQQGQQQEAIDNLKKARQESLPQHNPELYINILGGLQSLYSLHYLYLEAFQIKQEQRLIEYQYGFKAFAGASYLQQKQQDTNPTLTQTDRRAVIAPEITASGRQQDVDRLIDQRISHPKHKLTVIYGQSGVGKSSILTAGLLPALKQRSIDSRDTLPIVLRVYTNWIRALGKELAEALEEVRKINFATYLDSVEAIIKQLQENADRNLLTILIFDRIEDFFLFVKSKSKGKYFMIFYINA